MESHAKKSVERQCELTNETTQQLYEVATPCTDDHQLKKKKVSQWEKSTFCPQIVVRCSKLARIGRPDILWFVNKFAHAGTKWATSCDKRLARLISYIHRTNEYWQCCYVGNPAQQCRLRLFQDCGFAGDLQEDNINIKKNSVHFGRHTFVSISLMCKKQTSVSCSSAETEVMSLDAGFHMDGILALTFWDLVIEVFYSVPNSTKQD